jgi:hypothetical protein
VIVAVRDGVLPPSLLGRTLDDRVLAEIEAAGADACGENGEFHTFVVDGPIFGRPVGVELGQVSLRDGVWFLDLIPAAAMDTGDGRVKGQPRPNSSSTRTPAGR